MPRCGGAAHADFAGNPPPDARHRHRCGRRLNWRDRLLGDRRFQRAAAQFPLTRPIARRHTKALFDLCAGFIYSQTLVACMDLGLFDLLADQPRTAAQTGAACGLTEDAAACLLDSGVGLGLFARRRGERYRLATLGAALRGNPGIAAMIAHHALLYDDLRDPVALLRRPRGGTKLGAYWAYAGNAEPQALGGESVGRYTALMAASQPMIADEVLAGYDFSRHTCLLDVGGGDGSFLAAVGAAHPALRLMLFDLPPVAASAQARLNAAGLGARAACTGGSFIADALPKGADIISFVRVLHDHDDTTVAALLRAARAALPDGGTILVAEPMADTGSVAAYFGLYLRAMGSGRPRRAATLMAMLTDAGFHEPRRVQGPTPLLTQMLVANCKSELTGPSVSLG
jgi:demethylspheroidene O-methyltransferase